VPVPDGATSNRDRERTALEGACYNEIRRMLTFLEVYRTYAKAPKSPQAVVLEGGACQY
jgi:hypothetical protein